MHEAVQMRRFRSIAKNADDPRGRRVPAAGLALALAVALDIASCPPGAAQDRKLPAGVLPGVIEKRFEEPKRPREEFRLLLEADREEPSDEEKKEKKELKPGAPSEPPEPRPEGPEVPTRWK